jgi:SAM-dependent methyltransferase
VGHQDATRARFAASAEQLAALGEQRVEKARERMRRFVQPAGNERALDVGTGTGTLAFALSPLVSEVIGIDLVPEMLELAQRDGVVYPNLSFLEGDAQRLPFESEAFDLTVTSRTLHHVPNAEIAIAEMTRVTRVGGKVLVVDQIAAADPLEALAHNRIETLRDPSHVRVLSDQDFCGLFEANGLQLERHEDEHDDFELERYMALAGCTGEARDAVIAEVERLVRGGHAAGIALRRGADGFALTLTVAWYLTRRAVPEPVTTAT